MLRLTTNLRAAIADILDHNFAQRTFHPRPALIATNQREEDADGELDRTKILRTRAAQKGWPPRAAEFLSVNKE
jgi:hypothetical protein